MDRQQFYSTLEAMLTLVGNPLLVDVFPPSSPHNISARILRLGLAVNAFSSLEAYLKGCFDRAVDALANSPLKYDEFPDHLKEFVLVKAIDGLVNRSSRVRETAVKVALFEDAVQKIAKYKATPAKYVAFGFSPKGSNVESGDLTTGFKAFSVDKPWDKITTLTGSLGATQIDLANEYANLSQYRHRAAHEADANIPSADLDRHIRSSVMTGMAADILLSQTMLKLSVTTNKAGAKGDLDVGRIKLRFIDAETSGTYVERSNSAGPIAKRYTSLSNAIAVAGARSKARFLIVRDSGKRPLALVAANASGIL